MRPSPFPMKSPNLRISDSAPRLIDVDDLDRFRGPRNTDAPDTRAARTEPVMTCEDNLRFMSRLPDESMSLIVTSPPYNVGKEYENTTSLATYIESQTQVIAECVRLLKTDGSICWQVGNFVDDGEVVPLDAVLYPIFKRFGLKMRNRHRLAF